MDKNSNLNIHNLFFILLFIFVLFLYLGSDSHYWGLEEKTAKEILLEVGNGKTDPTKIKLSENQLNEIKSLIQLDPNGYNNGQKSLIVDHTIENILTGIGMGTIIPQEVKLTAQQYREIYDLIKKNPQNYNNSQKSLVLGKSGKDILSEVGNGKADPKKVHLNVLQLNEIKKLIKADPQDYNEAQKSLLKFNP